MAIPLPERSDGFRSLITLTSDWYFELDDAFRFTFLAGKPADAPEADTQHCSGKTPWELGLGIHENGDWSAYCRQLREGRPIVNTVIYRQHDDGGVSYYNVSTEPRYDDDGTLIGYRGVGRDITDDYRDQVELRQFQAAMDLSEDMIYLVDRATMRFIYMNETARRAARFESREEALKVPPHELLMVSREDLEKSYDELIAAGEAGMTAEVPSRTRDGSRTIVELHRRAMYLGGRWLIVSIAHDIRERKRAEWANARLRRMFAALSATNEAILRASSPEDIYQRVCDAAVEGGELAVTAAILVDPDSRGTHVAAVNGMAIEAVSRLDISVDPSRPEGEGLVGTAFRSGQPSVTNDYLADERTAPWRDSAEAGGIRSAAAVPLLRDGEAMGALLFLSADKDAFDEEIVKLLERMAENLVFALDNFEHEQQRKRNEERIQYLATHDGLTGLPNRAMLNQLLALTVESAARYGRRFAVFFVDLDRFKIVNDTLGHEAGDTLLQEKAAQLEECVRASDVIARIGGDEFVLLIQEVHEPGSVTAVARKLLAAALEPVEIAGQECRVTASIGIALYPGDGEDAETLLKNADMAMYQAKEEGKNNFQFYSEDLKVRSLERMTLETQLRQALQRDELSLAYQAKVDLTSDELTGVEALLRWNNPELGTVSPTQLIPVAEETGLIIPIGRWVLKTACAQNMAWQRQGLAALPVAVNLSPLQFADPDLTDYIAEVLAETGMPAHLLELEITESMVMFDTRKAVEVLDAIKEMGVRVAIDDFGTGYSSLSQLKQLPVEMLKVDRSFIRELPDHGDDRSLIDAIITMGKNLGLTLVAEGVETSAQHSYLREQGCDQMQGYYFNRPVAAEDFVGLLAEQTSSGEGRRRGGKGSNA